MGKVGRNELRRDEETQQREQEAFLYEQDIRSGRIDPFAGDVDWEEPDDDWQDEDEPEEEYDFDSQDDIFSTPLPDYQAPSQIAINQLSDEDTALIDAWWKTYSTLTDPDKLRSHIDKFMDSHPDLVVELDLEEEPLFQLEAMYVCQGRHEKYIEVLSRLRFQFPEAYFKGFSHYDNTMISWLVMNGQKEKVGEYLLEFSQDPTNNPDELFDLIHFLASWNCQDILADFLLGIYHEVYTSSAVMRGFKILDPMLTRISHQFRRRQVQSFW